MPRYIDADALIEKRWDADTRIGYVQVVDVQTILDAPTIDAAPVVRCRECKHQSKFFHKDKRMKDGGYWMYWCDGNEDQFVEHTVCGYDDDYCSYGEKMEEAK